MEADILTMCHSALGHGDGELSILGAWGILKVPEVPIVWPSCALAVRLSFNLEDDGEHTLGFRIFDKRGHVIRSQEGIRISLDASNGDHPTSYIGFAVQLISLELREDGPYAIVLTFDGMDRVRSQFYVGVEPIT